MQLKLLIISSFLFVFNLGQTQTSEEALGYMSEITEPLNKFKSETWNIIQTSVSSRSSYILDNQIAQLVSEINSTKEDIAKDEGFYGDLSLKVALKIFLRSAEDIISREFEEIKNLKIHSSHSFKNMEAYMMAQNKANERLSEIGVRFDEEVAKFADRHEITLSEEKSSLSKKIEKASQALSYYNQTYLSFFKVHEQKLKVYDALSTENLEKIKEENEILKLYCINSLERLDIQDAFFGDESLWLAANNIIKHYQFEANEVYSSAIRTIEKKQIFQMAQAVFAAIPEDEVTQNDVDHINALIVPLNTALEIQHSIFNKANEEREAFFKEWNDTLRSFSSNYLN